MQRMLPLVAPEALTRKESESEVRARLRELSERWKVDHVAREEDPKPHAEFVVFSTHTDGTKAREFLKLCEDSIIRVLGGSSTLIVETSLTVEQPATKALLRIDESGVDLSARLLGLAGLPKAEFHEFLAKRVASEYQLLLRRAFAHDDEVVKPDLQVTLGNSQTLHVG